MLVTGATGSGKTTTLASLIDYVNQQIPKRIVTIEDPIEFVHGDRKAHIIQREVGEDTATFAEGLRRALRQDPNIILVLYLAPSTRATWLASGWIIRKALGSLIAYRLGLLNATR